MIVVQVEQGSQEWFQARRGVPTASEFCSIMRPVKGGASTAQETYIDGLIGDIMSSYYPPGAESYFTNSAIRHGQDTETEARDWFAMQVDEPVSRVGFILTDDGRFGCSPDGLIGESAGLELKCPQQKNHVGWYRRKETPAKHKPQVHGGLLICGGLLEVYPSPTVDEVIANLARRGLQARHVPSTIKSWHFVSYHLGLPALDVEVFPDEFTAKLGAELELFWPKFIRALELVQGGTPCSTAVSNSGPPLQSVGPSSEPF